MAEAKQWVDPMTGYVHIPWREPDGNLYFFVYDDSTGVRRYMLHYKAEAEPKRIETWWH